MILNSSSLSTTLGGAGALGRSHSLSLRRSSNPNRDLYSDTTSILTAFVVVDEFNSDASRGRPLRRLFSAPSTLPSSLEGGPGEGLGGSGMGLGGGRNASSPPLPSSSSFTDLVGFGEAHLAVEMDPESSFLPLSKFIPEDGMTYTSISVGRNGEPVICGAKGCRPLTESEKINILRIGFGLEMVGAEDRTKACDTNGSDDKGTQVVYWKLLADDPANPMLLCNYAQFLHEVQHDDEKAEEYYERAVLAAPSDSYVLSQYAKLVWNVHKDHDRAEVYHNRATQADPEDCYAMASYASFLWDAEEEDEECDSSLVLDDVSEAGTMHSVGSFSSPSLAPK